ncbi:hypothetical protein ACT16_08665 [Mycobacterium heckeshornense]|nr:hypothetical protein ACT16_08665 [Mycobacterium heckeshornense]
MLLVVVGVLVAPAGGLLHAERSTVLPGLWRVAFCSASCCVAPLSPKYWFPFWTTAPQSGYLKVISTLQTGLFSWQSELAAMLAWYSFGLFVATPMDLPSGETAIAPHSSWA